MNIEPTDLPPQHPLVARYLSGERLLLDRLGGPPSLDGVREAVRRVSRQGKGWPLDRAKLATSLRAAHRSLDPSPATLANIDALADANSYVVATGQQPGFLTGPLYTLWKTVHAIELSRRLSATGLGRFIPVFWIASDDHDLPEVEGCQLLNAAGEVRRFRVPLGTDEEVGHPPSAYLPVPDQAREVVDAFFAEVPDGPHRDALRELAEPRPGERWPAWFARILLRLFADDGLVIFEPFENADWVHPSLREEANRPDFVIDQLKRGASTLASHGLDAPLPTDRESALFIYDGTRRRRIEPSDDVDAILEAQGVAALSADAGLRPAIQSTVLPTVVSIGGPGELAYWLQLTEVFDALDVPRPVFWPRFSATLIEPRVRRAIEQLGIEADSVFDPHFEDASPSAEVDSALPKSWSDRSEVLLRATEQFVAELSAVGGSLPKRTKELQKSVDSAVERILHLAAEEVRGRAGITQKKRRLVSGALYPGEKPQERVLNGLPFLSRAGIDFFSRVAAAIDPCAHAHQRIDVSSSS